MRWPSSGQTSAQGFVPTLDRLIGSAVLRTPDEPGRELLMMLDTKRSSKSRVARGSSTCCQKVDSRVVLAAKSVRTVNHGVFLLETLLREIRQFSGREDDQLRQFLRQLPPHRMLTGADCSRQ